jgi:hypothetical protein
MTDNVEITTSLENTDNIEIVNKYLPDITFIFSNKKEYKLRYLMSMDQEINNNCTFKNAYTFTTALIPFNLLNELEKGRQIIKVIITEIMKDDQGENFNRSLAVCFPEVIVFRKIDTTGDNVLWTFKINYKTL